jgi:hypothetical protein
VDDGGRDPDLDDGDSGHPRSQQHQNNGKGDTNVSDDSCSEAEDGRLLSKLHSSVLFSARRYWVSELGRLRRRHALNKQALSELSKKLHVLDPTASHALSTHREGAGKCDLSVDPTAEEAGKEEASPSVKSKIDRVTGECCQPWAWFTALISFFKMCFQSPINECFSVNVQKRRPNSCL